MARSSIRTCACCGHPLPDDSVLGALTPLQQRVFFAIKRAGSAGIQSTRVMDVVYAEDPNGGPENQNIIAVVAKQMNKRLARFGLVLRGRRGPGGYYTLEKLENTDASPD